MGHRLMITLDPKEFVALAEMASKELRHPREQLRILVREEARRMGLPLGDAVNETTSGRLGHAASATR